MKKYMTPEIELEIISTSDICAVSTTLSFEDEGSATKISWNDSTKWN